MRAISSLSRCQATVLFTALALWASAASALPEGNSIEFSNCTLALPGTSVTAPARCGFLEVPENPTEPDGRQIRIHVAVGAANAQTPAPDPLFFFAGGPGQAASETWVMLRNALARVRKQRDIVMIDQRGTGQSNPLHCKSETELDLNATLDFEQLAAETRACLEGLDADPRMYTTSIAMADVERVRQAMGYGPVNLFGVSYGTRAAQVFLRLYPESVRSMTLDSVVPMQLALGQEHAPMLDAAVDAVLADCAATPDCAGRFPVTAADLDGLVRELRAAPREVTIPNPLTGQPETIRFSAETLALALRFLSYSSETQALLPLLLHEAVFENSLERLAAQALLVMNSFNLSIARGMELSVTCAEDFPFLDLDQDQSGTLIGNLFLEAMRSQCEVWPRGTVPEGFHSAIESEVPSLLFSGERDPVTPPRYADMAAAGLKSSRALLVKGQSHAVMRNHCVQDTIAAFIENGSLEGLDTSCVDAIRGAPFFTSLLGPEP